LQRAELLWRNDKRAIFPHPCGRIAHPHARRRNRVTALALLKLPRHLGYLILFALVGAESTGVPVPGETALIAAGVFAHRGQFKIELVIALAAAAAISGDNLGYLIGRTGGRRLLERPGFVEQRRHAVLVRGEPFFAKHGPKAVFLGRWVAGLRIAAAWLAGVNRMPWLIFLFWNALGAVAWATSVGLLAYYLGPTAERVFKAAGIVGAVGAVLFVAAFVAWRHFHPRRLVNPQTSAAPPGRSPPGRGRDRSP
jgi:membrane protein DedA with SNARE-associated domain